MDIHVYDTEILMPPSFRVLNSPHSARKDYATHGIRTVQLKGVGLSALYPVPSHREGGDLDIYTFSADASKLTDGQANALADELMRRQGIDVKMRSYKHSNFRYRDVPVESHKCFLNVQHPHKIFR